VEREWRYRNLPHSPPMRSDANHSLDVLNRHIEDRDTRQPRTVWPPVCAAILRDIDADVGAGEEASCLSRIDGETVYRHVGQLECSGPVDACQYRSCV